MFTFIVIKIVILNVLMAVTDPITYKTNYFYRQFMNINFFCEYNCDNTWSHDCCRSYILLHHLIYTLFYLQKKRRRKNHGRVQGTEHWTYVSPRPQKNENEVLFIFRHFPMCFSPSDYIFFNVSLTVSPFSKTFTGSPAVQP